MKKRSMKLSLSKWIFVALLLALGVIAGAGIYSIFFVRRETVPYRQDYEYSIDNPSFFGLAHALADPVPIEGNAITLLNNGDEIFPAMLKAIRQADSTINFEAFLFHSGTVGTMFIDALAERARQGVRVRVLLDGIGSSSLLLQTDVERMKASGIEFSYYHPFRSWRFDRANRRSHCRIMVVDGKIAFTGGAGFSDEWLGDGTKPGEWREIHARIEGPIVAKLQAVFQQHWIQSTGRGLSGPAQFPFLAPAGTLKSQAVLSTAFSLAPMPWLQAACFEAAEERIWITNPYCVPSDSQVRFLIEAAERGVDVRILVPGKVNDQPWTVVAAGAAFRKLIKSGVRLYRYQPSMIHQKTMVIDGKFSVFGSSNLDPRSSAVNEELDITVYDETFGKQMEEIFLRDLDKSSEAEIKDFQPDSRWDYFMEFIARKTEPQL